MNGVVHAMVSRNIVSGGTPLLAGLLAALDVTSILIRVHAGDRVVTNIPLTNSSCNIHKFGVGLGRLPTMES